MPKVVSWANRICTNANRNLKDEKFHVFYCKKCSTHVLITDAELPDLPKRRTDGAPVFDIQSCVVKLNTKPKAEPVKLRRDRGIECQYQHLCPTCENIVGYQCVPHGKEAQLVYLVDDSIVWPKYRRKSPWVCRVCGYTARDLVGLQSHMKQRNHENQEEGRYGVEDVDAPMPPLIIG